MVNEALRGLLVGRASFAVAIAYQDESGLAYAYETSGRVTVSTTGRSSASFAFDDTTKSRFRAFARGALNRTLVQNEEDRDSLPDIKASELTAREIVFMLQSFFDVAHKDVQLMLPLGFDAERTTVALLAATPAQLQEYYSYALQCQKRGERPEVTMIVPPSTHLDEEEPPVAPVEDEPEVEDWSASIVSPAPEDVVKQVADELAAKKKKGRGGKRKVVHDSDEGDSDDEKLADNGVGDDDDLNRPAEKPEKTGGEAAGGQGAS
ncbi:hypothetical protein R3P38DRAFT_3223748 [Favolaschia claudopus]|uniref:Uncharacterized protein n=1 Tax=Favolaschia claudopus TaxID=2862362 RepID=A0AAV9ZWQ2_9AGAR